MRSCETVRDVLRRRPGAGFTLVELLVVIAIISLLASLLAPSLKRASYMGRVATCLSNCRQQHTAITSYASANVGQFPKHLDNSPEYLRSHNHDPNNNVIDNMKRWGRLNTEMTICPITAVFGSRYADTTVGGDYGGIDAGHPNCLGTYMWMAAYQHWNGVVLQDGEPDIPMRHADCSSDTAMVTHRISLLDPYIRDIGHHGLGLYTKGGGYSFEEHTTTVDQPVAYGDGHGEVHDRTRIEWRFTIPGVGDYWY